MLVLTTATELTHFTLQLQCTRLRQHEAFHNKLNKLLLPSADGGRPTASWPKPEDYVPGPLAHPVCVSSGYSFFRVTEWSRIHQLKCLVQTRVTCPTEMKRFLLRQHLTPHQVWAQRYCSSTATVHVHAQPHTLNPTGLLTVTDAPWWPKFRNPKKQHRGFSGCD